MADNTQIASGVGDIIRDKDRSGVKTQIVLLDINAAGAETLMQAGQALAAASIPVVLTAIQQAALTPPAAITGFALEAGGHLATIDTSTARIPAQGQALAAGCVPVVLTAIQQAALTPPAAIAGFSTAANQSTELASLATIAAAVQAATPAGANAIGSVVANAGTNLNTSALALDATLAATAGSVAAGVAGTKSSLAGGVYNTSLPTLTTGQQVAAQFDSSGRLIVNVGAGSSGNAAASATGSAVPASADFAAVNVGGTLRGRTGVNPSGVVYAAQTDIASVGGTTFALGQQLAAVSVPVVLTAIQITALTPPAAITGFALEAGHLATIDTSTARIPAQGQALAAASLPVVLTAAQVTTLTPPAAITGFALETGGNLGAIAGKDFATQTTLALIKAKTDNIDVALSTRTKPADSQVTTIADGADVTLGAKANPPATIADVTAWSVISLLKGLWNKLAGVLTVAGDVPDGATDSGNPAKVGAVFNTTLPTYTNGQRTTNQSDNRGNLSVSLATKLDSVNDQVGVQPQDVIATTGAITVADVGTASAANSLGQTITTGTPTAGSFVTVPLNGQTCLALQISGTNSNVFAFDLSMDGGTTYRPATMESASLGTTLSTLTISDNKAYILRTSAGGQTQFRVRCTTHTSGTATVLIQPGFGVANVSVGQFGGPWTVAPQALATGGATPYHLPSSANTTNATNVKASAGTLYGIEAFNTAAYTIFLKLYDKASSPTVGTDTPVKTIAIPPTVGGALGGIVRSYPVGIVFANGISYALTKLVADSDATVILAADVSPLDLDYK